MCCGFLRLRLICLQPEFVDITLVSTVEEAFKLNDMDMDPNLILAGEVNTLPIDGFDLGNSPIPFVNLDLHGRHIVQCTSCGTHGVIQAAAASHILLCSLCCASVTTRYKDIKGWISITLNENGIQPGG